MQGRLTSTWVCNRHTPAPFHTLAHPGFRMLLTILLLQQRMHSVSKRQARCSSVFCRVQCAVWRQACCLIALTLAGGQTRQSVGSLGFQPALMLLLLSANYLYRLCWAVVFAVDAFDQTMDYSTQIFSLGVLLSSLLVFNQVRPHGSGQGEGMRTRLVRRLVFSLQVLSGVLRAGKGCCSDWWS